MRRSAVRRPGNPLVNAAGPSFHRVDEGLISSWCLQCAKRLSSVIGVVAVNEVILLATGVRRVYPIGSAQLGNTGCLESQIAVRPRFHWSADSSQRSSRNSSRAMDSFSTLMIRWQSCGNKNSISS